MGLIYFQEGEESALIWLPIIPRESKLHITNIS